MRSESTKLAAGRVRSRRYGILAAAAVTGTVWPAGVVHAAVSTWTGAVSANYNDSGNWSAGVPGLGATTPTPTGTATDVATFPTTVTMNTNVMLDQGYTLGSVLFSGAGTTAYNLAGGSLMLTSSTTVNALSQTSTAGTAAAPVNQTVASPVVLLNAAAGTSGTTLFNAAGNANTTLLVTGSVTGSATTGGTNTLRLVGGQKGEIDGVISDGANGGQVAVVVAGLVGGVGPSWTLAGANTFTGTVSVLGANPTAATLRVSSINSVVTNAALGTVHAASSNLGAPTTVANGTIAFGANSVLVYTGPGETTDRVISLTGGTNGGGLTASGTGPLKFTSDLRSSGATAATKIFALAGTGTGEFAGAVADDTAAQPISVSKAGGGTWTLSGANTYTGTTTITGGALNAATINSVGTARVASSSLGAPTTAANGTIAFTGGSLTYTGAGETTDRGVALTGATGTGGTLTQSGTGVLRFTSNVAQSGGTGATGAKSLTLAGSTAGTGELAGNYGDDLSSTTTTGIKAQLNKSGTGTWTATGNNSYTGSTVVSGGTLRLGSGTALGASFAVPNLATTAGSTTATYPTPTGSVGLLAAGNFIDGAGLTPNTFVTGVTSANGVTTVTLSVPATATATASLTGSAQVQLNTAGATLDLNGQSVTSKHVNLVDGTSLVNNGTTAATVAFDVQNQVGVTPSTTGTLSVGGTGDINMAGVNGGTLNKVGPDTVTLTPNVVAVDIINLIAGAGTLRMGSANALAPTSTLTEAGGTYGTGGLNQSLSSLSVTLGNGTIDFGTGSSTLAFGSLAGFSGTNLTITNWTGTAGQAGGTDELIFNDPSGLTPQVLSMINFAGYNPGSTLVGNAVVPNAGTTVPEPASLGLLAVGLLSLSRRSTRQSKAVR